MLAQKSPLSAPLPPSLFSMPAVADEVTNLGPVGPNEPILTSVGSSRVIAFYLPGSNQCAIHAVIWDKTKVNSDTSSSSHTGQP